VKQRRCYIDIWTIRRQINSWSVWDHWRGTRYYWAVVIVDCK